MKKGFSYISCIFFLTAFLISGCATTSNLTLDYDRDTDFAQYRTYAWAPPSGPGPNLSLSQNDLIETRVKDYVDRILAAKGYREAAPEQADFLITYHNIYKEKQSVRTVGNYSYAPGYYWRTECSFGKRRHSRWARPYYVQPRTYVEYYTEGTFVLDVVDRDSQKLVWRGSAVSILQDTSPDAQDQKMQEAANQLLEKFPPPSPPKDVQVESAPPKSEGY